MAFVVDRIVAVVIVREINEAGTPVREIPSEPTPIFRGTTPDVWALADECLKQQQAALGPRKKKAKPNK